jgi:hypothetical protein
MGCGEGVECRRAVADEEEERGADREENMRGKLGCDVCGVVWNLLF